jgi:hypothetical protein
MPEKPKSIAAEAHLLDAQGDVVAIVRVLSDGTVLRIGNPRLCEKLAGLMQSVK